ncbi:hypothetical protein [Streptomyces sp. KLOTTS4A1]|uniref:hypothetical protein n=1 Tax=Streptomyces sp. KLOTTS4A1 TaxID=3390996 RepID=UPI0039F5847E
MTPFPVKREGQHRRWPLALGGAALFGAGFGAAHVPGEVLLEGGAWLVSNAAGALVALIVTSATFHILSRWRR